MARKDTQRGSLIGADVYTADGEHLGVIREVADCCFKVDARFAVDYWLPLDLIARTEQRQVAHLAVPNQALPDAKNRANDLLVESAAREAAIHERHADDTAH